MNHTLELAKYNLWANKKITSLLIEAGEEKIHQPQVSSFPTIFKTLLHMWDGQEVWMMRLNGESVKNWPSNNFNGSYQEVTNQLLKSSSNFVSFIENLTITELENVIKYYAMDGTEFKNTISEIIMHVMNHATYHRGQLITMLRITGFENVVSTDMIRYFRGL